MKDEDLVRRREDLLADLRVQLPLDALRSSEIMFDNIDTDAGMFVRFYLQRSLPRILELNMYGDQSVDLFTEDIMLIKRAAHRVREEFEEALKGARDPSADPRLARVRGQIDKERPKGALRIYNSPEGELMPLGDVPRLMPNAVKCEVEFVVTSIERHRVRANLSAVRLPAARQAKPHAAYTAAGQSSVYLMRDGHARGEKAGLVFSASLETGAVLKATVRLDFRWVDGSLARWTMYEAADFSGENGVRRHIHQAALFDIEWIPDHLAEEGLFARHRADNDDDSGVWDVAA